MITKEKKIELLNILNTQKLFGIEHINHFDLGVEQTNKNQLPMEINELSSYVDNCSLCELSKSKIASSFAMGDVNSKIFLISLRNSFRGEKGFSNIKDMVENGLNVNINDIYMTNILKCDVQKSKSILDSEVKKCLIYLEQQINILKPELIITFGEAFKYLMKNNDEIIDVSGNVYIYKNIKLIPLLEFDFIHKNPSYKDKMIRDIIKIKNIMDKK